MRLVPRAAAVGKTSDALGAGIEAWATIRTHHDKVTAAVGASPAGTAGTTGTAPITEPVGLALPVNRSIKTFFLRISSFIL